MTMEPIRPPESLGYRAGLNRIQEAVISSHFMHEMCSDSRLELYDDERFKAKSLTIPAEVVSGRLLPDLLRAAGAFAHDRASAAKGRALRNSASYPAGPSQLGPAEFITEVMFDRQFRNGSRETCSRQDVWRRVAQRIAMGAPIEMAIAALPYKFGCPLKTRGQSPDLAEVNFIIGLYEIVATVEALYREACPNVPGPLARFTVISDGTRFNALTNEPGSVVEAYQRDLVRWIGKVGLNEYIEFVDYQKLLREHLPADARKRKSALRERALCQYAKVMWAIFEPCDMAATLQVAARIDPDPVTGNAEGRFVSLLKSLVFTVRYRSLDRFRSLPADQFRALYRQLTGHIFEPFARLSTAELRRFAEQDCSGFPGTLGVKEYLRQEMLQEVWKATIQYIAEIKSDREQSSEPVSSCLPDHFRWTIHAKPGQLGLLTPSALGRPVLAWAGAAVFKRAKGGGIRLCALPVLALEGGGAIPVTSDCSDGLGPIDQPLFYIYPDVTFNGLDDFLASLPGRLMRKRAS